MIKNLANVCEECEVPRTEYEAFAAQVRAKKGPDFFIRCKHQMIPQLYEDTAYDPRKEFPSLKPFPLEPSE